MAYLYLYLLQNSLRRPSWICGKRMGMRKGGRREMVRESGQRKGDRVEGGRRGTRERGNLFHEAVSHKI